MYFQHHSTIWSDFPTLAAGAIAVSGIHPNANTEADSNPWLTKAKQRLAENDESTFAEIDTWRRAYSQMGLKPTKYRCAAESLLRRLRKEGSLPAVHPLVDLCNALSVAFAIPIAVIDADKLTGGTEVRYTNGDESYIDFSEGELTLPEKEVAFVDEGNHAHSRRWCFRQSKKSVITPETQNVLIVCEALHDGAADDIAELIETLTTLLQNYWNVTNHKVLTKDDPRMEFAVQKGATISTSTAAIKDDAKPQKNVRVLSGFQPSGKFHLGNYFGSIQPNIEWQKQSDVSFFMVADLHSLTTLRDPELLRENIIDNVLDFLACGLNPDHSILFRQSDISEHAELTWVLSCLCPMGLMERAVSYKDKVERGLEANVGLFTYPILQTSDIVLYDIEKVPVGKDQKQHLEMARDLAIKLNNAYGNTLVVPDAVIRDDVALVPGTDGQKMSKSYGNTIPLFGSEESITQAIMGTVTDSKGMNDPKDPDSCVIFQIHKLFLDETETLNLADEYRNGLPYSNAKKKLLSTYLDFIAPLKTARDALTEKDALEVLEEGKKKAKITASATMERVRKAVGLR